MGSPCNRDQTVEDEEPAPEVDARPLLMEGAISRLVTNGLNLLSDVLKEEVMRQVEQMQMELEHKLNIMVKVLAIASSTLSCFNLMALASITIKSRFTSWLMLPHL